MTRYWLENSIAAKGLFIIGLVAIGGASALQLALLLQTYVAGEAINPQRVGSFAQMVSFLPMLLANLQRRVIAPKEGWDDDPRKDIDFVEAPEDRQLALMSVLSLTIGSTISVLLSDPSVSSWWNGPFILIVWGSLLCAAVFNYLRPYYGIRLAPQGVTVSTWRSRVISWHDIRDVRLSGRGSQQVALDLIDPLRYGLNKATFKFSAYLLRSTPEDIVAAIRQRQAIYAPSQGA